MANFAFNIAKGREVEYYQRVDNNDPANSALIVVPLSASGTQAQGEDLDTLALVLSSGFFTERTSGGWSRKVLTDTELSAQVPDDTNNWNPITMPAILWSGPTTGNNITGVLLCYDSDTTGGTDTNIVPIAHYDFAISTDGSNVQIDAGDWIRAT